ncbi:regulator of G-protein signaling 9-like [Eleginops maclovinus]
MALSLRRLLKGGCTPGTMFASLSPKCHSAASTSSRIQPISPDQPSQAPPRRTGNFFQIKVDIPPECRIYPIESEDEEEESRVASRGGVGAKEIICPWESLTTQNGTG